MSVSRKDYVAVLDACIPSEEVRAHLSRTVVTKSTVGQIIRNAPLSLYEKATLLKRLASKENILHDLLDVIERQDGFFAKHPAHVAMFVIEDSFSFQYKMIRKAIDAFEQSGDAVFNLVEKWYDDELLDEKSSSGAPFLSTQKALEYIRCDMEECGFDETTTGWYGIEKWVADGDGALILRYTYTLIGETPIFWHESGLTPDPCSLRWRASQFHTGLLDIPLPYETGDIVTIDCIPFAPPKPALIIKGVSDTDYPMMLSRNQRGAWGIDSLKLGYFSNGEAGTVLALSPCYKLRSHSEPLTSDEEILYEVQEWLRSDPSRGRFLWEAKYQSGIYEMTPDDIRELMKRAESNL